MEQIIAQALDYIRDLFDRDFSGHDYFHSVRVYKTAVELAKQEGADLLLVSLAALLHDVDDIKLSPETYAGKDNAVAFLRSVGIPEEQIAVICEMIDSVSYRGTDSVCPSTIEGKCVQDADRLDALGAIGIARAFAFGGNHNRVMYDPDIPPEMNMNQEQYRNHVSTTVNHFYEKLFLLKDMMTTEHGREAAIRRERYMKEYIAEFMCEWEGEDLLL